MAIWQADPAYQELHIGLSYRPTIKLHVQRSIAELGSRSNFEGHTKKVMGNSTLQ